MACVLSGFIDEGLSTKGRANHVLGTTDQDGGRLAYLRVIELPTKGSMGRALVGFVDEGQPAKGRETHTLREMMRLA
ncbi:unnamed protein product [Lupinus luteus]|uniref:Uncharacterized protein n=1 Tax=Lupinus luteus TaxID=3873 RepID=A0AAV1XMV9_LUPLU